MNAAENHAQGCESLQRALTRIEDLNQRIESQAAAARQRQGVIVATVVLLALVMSFGLSQIAALANTLDVDTVAYIGRQQAQDHLPAGRAALQAALASQAPEIVSQALDAALDSLPAARSMLVAQMNAHLDGINSEFEATTLASMRRTIRSAKQGIEAAYPDVPSPDRELLVARAAAEDVTMAFRASLTQLYPEYSLRMRQFTDRVEFLGSTPPQQLGARDRKQRQLIETALQLAVRARAGGF